MIVILTTGHTTPSPFNTLIEERNRIEEILSRNLARFLFRDKPVESTFQQRLRGIVNHAMVIAPSILRKRLFLNLTNEIFSYNGPSALYQAPARLLSLGDPTLFGKEYDTAIDKLTYTLSFMETSTEDLPAEESEEDVVMVLMPLVVAVGEEGDESGDGWRIVSKRLVLCQKRLKTSARYETFGLEGASGSLA